MKLLAIALALSASPLWCYRYMELLAVCIRCHCYMEQFNSRLFLLSTLHTFRWCRQSSNPWCSNGRTLFSWIVFYLCSAWNTWHATPLWWYRDNTRHCTHVVLYSICAWNTWHPTPWWVHLTRELYVIVTWNTLTVSFFCCLRCTRFVGVDNLQIHGVAMGAPYSCEAELYFICTVHGTLGTPPRCGGIRGTAPMLYIYFANYVMCAWHVWNSWLLIRQQPLGWDTWTWFMIVRKRTPPSETLLCLYFIYKSMVQQSAPCLANCCTWNTWNLEHPIRLWWYSNTMRKNSWTWWRWSYLKIAWMIIYRKPTQ